MPKRILTGKVVSNKADNTVTVLVERRIMHPIYKKFVTKSKKIHAHDKDNKFQPGDSVEIIETKPISGNSSSNLSKILMPVKSCFLATIDKGFS